METVLTIGKLADAAGVNIETIRYYQRRGLLDEPPKPLGGHRRYAPEQAKRVRFIKRAQALGFAPAGMPGLFRRKASPVPLPAGTSKITFTSGTTGAPKGVHLDAARYRVTL